MAVHYRQDISATTVPLGIYSVLVIAVVRRLYIWVGLWIASLPWQLEPYRKDAFLKVSQSFAVKLAKV